MENHNELEILIGKKLIQISFILDYLQLNFENNLLTCYRWPEIVQYGNTYTRNDIVYKNILYTLIGKGVTQVNLFENVSLIIKFSDDIQVLLSLDSNIPSINSEIAIFQDENNNWSFFN